MISCPHPWQTRLRLRLIYPQIYGHPIEGVNGGWNISPDRQQWISSLMTLGAFLSSGFAGPIAGLPFMGRKATIWSACLLCCVANAIMMATTNIGGLYAGRLLIGLANGLFMTFAQLYIQETSPARYRGLMISSFQVWTSVGTLVGTIVDNFTSPIDGRNSYLIPLGLIYIIPAVMSVGLLFIPESPRWLMQQGRREKALKSLRWLRPYGETEVQREAADIQKALDDEHEISRSASAADMFSNPIDLRRTLLSVGALSTQGASGAMYMIGILHLPYSVSFFSFLLLGISSSPPCSADLALSQLTGRTSSRWPTSAMPSKTRASSLVSASWPF